MDLSGYLIAQESSTELENLKSPKDLYQWMKSHIKYQNFSKLQSPEVTKTLGKGSCHDQVLVELYYLKSLGLRLHPLFFMEVNESTQQGGMTHSFVTYTHKDQGPMSTYWFEHAASNWSGIRKYDSVKVIKTFIKSEHDAGKWGNRKSYPTVVFGTFKGSPGDDLQTIVTKSLGE